MHWLIERRASDVDDTVAQGDGDGVSPVGGA